MPRFQPLFLGDTPAWRLLFFPVMRFHCCCCCCYWPPVCEVCPNYEVVEFQPRTLTTPDLGSVAYCYVLLLDPSYPLLLPSKVLPPLPSSSVFPLHSIIFPPGRHTSPSHHIEKNVTLSSFTSHYQRPTLPLLPRPHLAY